MCSWLKAGGAAELQKGLEESSEATWKKEQRLHKMSAELLRILKDRWNKFQGYKRLERREVHNKGVRILSSCA